MREFQIRVLTATGTHETHTVISMNPGDKVPAWYNDRPVRWSLDHAVVATLGVGGAGVACGGDTHFDAMANLVKHYGWKSWEAVGPLQKSWSGA